MYETVLLQKLGVTIEARVRVQLNLMVEHAEIHPVRQFPSIVFPIMWLEEVSQSEHIYRARRLSHIC